MTIFKRVLTSSVLLLLVAGMLIGCGNGDVGKETNVSPATETETETKTSETETEVKPVEPELLKMEWPEDRIFPMFSKPQGRLKAFRPTDLTEDEKITMACLEGIINANETRMVILEDSDVQPWLKQYNFNITIVDSAKDKYELLQEYAKEVSGVVLYATNVSKHYVNLACSIANVKGGIPMTKKIYETWKSKGIDLPIIEDLTTKEMKNAVEIYQYFYDEYWFECDQRLLVIQRNDFSKMRDLAAAAKCPVIYLSSLGGEDERFKAQTDLFKMFLMDMIPGKSIMTGWYADEERALMCVGAQCGISCVPSDHFSNATVFSQKMSVNIPTVPDMPNLENKIYIAFYFSDGDNIQYDMHAMREYWNNNKAAMDSVPVTWTISPALADVAPGMMNYYYDSAPSNVSFASGPSGMGYTMPVNTFGEYKGENFTNEKAFTEFVKMTNSYVQRSGLRVVTIWDSLNEMHRKVYSTYAPYLNGITVMNFTNGSLDLKLSGVTNNMLIQQMTPGYFAKNAEGTTPITELMGYIDNAVKYQKYKGNSPAFVTVQVSVWAFHDMKEVVVLQKALQDKYGADKVEFVRADHYFNLYYEANGLPVDLALKSGTKATATSNAEKAALTLDGTPSKDSIWVAAEKGTQSVTYTLDKTYALNRMTVALAGANGLNKSLNAKAFKIETSMDGQSWKEVAGVENNTEDYVYVSFDKTDCTQVRITITDAGADGIARIADVNIYGISK